MSKLTERKVATGVTPTRVAPGKEAASALARAIRNGAQRGRDVEIPGLGRAFCQLVGQREAERVDLEVLELLREHDLALDVLTANRAESAKAVRTLAVAMRDPDDHAQPFGSLEEWQDLDEHLINAAWHTYGDVNELLDPMTADHVAPEHVVQIRDAVAKKDLTLLRSFGVHTLSSYLLFTAEQQPISPTQSATSGPSSLEPSTSAPTSQATAAATADAS